MQVINGAQEATEKRGGWGFRQCARSPLGNGLCKQHCGIEGSWKMPAPEVK